MAKCGINGAWRQEGAPGICCDEVNHGPNWTIIVQVRAILSPLGILASLGFEPMALRLPQHIYYTQYYAPLYQWNNYFPNSKLHLNLFLSIGVIAKCG